MASAPEVARENRGNPAAHQVPTRCSLDPNSCAILILAIPGTAALHRLDCLQSRWIRARRGATGQICCSHQFRAMVLRRGRSNGGAHAAPCVGGQGPALAQEGAGVACHDRMHTPAVKVLLDPEALQSFLKRSPAIRPRGARRRRRVNGVAVQRAPQRDARHKVGVGASPAVGAGGRGFRGHGQRVLLADLQHNRQCTADFDCQRVCFAQAALCE
mmetsp:Transcript_106604/g.340128  ORF Transcript_106604/g.340128 Transcript_106604/m.340128 type:complete len:215 (+) Transcript_106604:233-877(+)